MSRSVTNRLIYGFGRFIHYRKGHRFHNAYLSHANQFWCEIPAFSVINRSYSIQQSSTNTPTTSSTPSNVNTTSNILPKINALLSETKVAATKLKSNRIINNSRSLFRRKWDAFFNWYDEISHTNEVREAHKQVEDLQEKLNEAQHLRRDVSKALNDIRYELQMCYADQANCQKNDPRYLELIRREIEVNFWIWIIESFFENNWKQFAQWKRKVFSMFYLQNGYWNKTSFCRFRTKRSKKLKNSICLTKQNAIYLYWCKRLWKHHTKRRRSIQTRQNTGQSLDRWRVKRKFKITKLMFFIFSFAFPGALLGICGTAFSFYNRNDLLSDINKEFVVIRQDTKSINEQVQLLANEQRDFLRAQQQRDREQLEREARYNVVTSNSQRENGQSDESWVHWIARKTYVISIYRYFVPNTVN